MLFRTNIGALIELKKYDYPNDHLYYAKIMEIKKPIMSSNAFAKLKKTFDKKNNQ